MEAIKNQAAGHDIKPMTQLNCDEIMEILSTNQDYFIRGFLKRIASGLVFCLSMAQAKQQGETTLRIAVMQKQVGRKQNKMNERIYAYDAVVQASQIGKGGAYVPFPYDVREAFGKGRVKVHATFDGEPYEGSIVNMGVQNADGSVCYVIGMLKSIREKLGKQPGDSVHVTVRERP